MQDQYGRMVDYLRLSLTEACNFKCQYCVPDQEQRSTVYLPAPRAVALGEAAVSIGVTKIRLTGGEPTSHPQLLDICARLACLEGLKTLAITTNGSRLQRLAQPLARAGVNRVNISLDTLQPARFRQMTQGGEWAKVWAGIEMTQAVWGHLKLDVVLIGGFNEDEIPAFVRLADDLPWSIRFIELMPMGPCQQWPKTCFIPVDTVLKHCPDLRPIGQEGVARLYQRPDAKGTIGLISPLSQHFCHTCRRIRITADESLKPCLHSRGEIRLKGLEDEILKQALREGIWGKPAQHHLEKGGSETLRVMKRIGG